MPDPIIYPGLNLRLTQWEEVVTQLEAMPTQGLLQEVSIHLRECIEQTKRVQAGARNCYVQSMSFPFDPSGKNGTPTLSVQL